MTAVVWQVAWAVCAATGAAVILVLLAWALLTGGRTVTGWYRFERAYRRAQREDRALAAAEAADLAAPGGTTLRVWK